MDDVAHRTAEEWEAHLGGQVRDLRLRRNMTQARLADLAGVSVSTVQNLESGAGSSLSTLVKVARALGRTDWVQEFAPPAQQSPMQVLRERRAAEAATRQRASRATSSR
jgi:transcriptional regulator with XRE-family HTH domain